MDTNPFESIELPAALSIDAWSGGGAAGAGLESGASRWGARKGLPHSQSALPFEAPVDPKNWSHPSVGFGVLLPDPEDPAMTPAARATADDAEEPIRELLAARPGSVVLRWRPSLGTRFLRRYFPDGRSQDPTIGLTQFGVAANQLPRYVLIVGGPDVIPWEVQYALSVRHAVGRLPLTGAALQAYVSALLAGWPGEPLDVAAPVLWTVDHGGGDITSLMRATLMTPLARAMEGTLAGLTLLGGAPGRPSATAESLCTSLAQRRPALLVTSSHGRTGPLDDADAMRATLGLPVDADFTTVTLDDLTAAVPGGAVWFAQGCCTAGAAGTSLYDGLVAAGTDVHTILQTVAGLGSIVSPAALALLGRPQPVRAVLGHVEPTFDWTLRVPETGQKLGAHLVQALTTNAFHGVPLGLALAEYREGVGVLHSEWADRRSRLDDGDTSVREVLTWLRLTALDRQSLVLLGDPTVTLPPL